MGDQGTTRATRLGALIALATLTGVWAWWAAKEGAYFGAVMYPGMVVLCAGLVLMSSRAAWRPALALALPAKIALGALIGLGVWSGLSATWSSAPDVAVADAQRILAYALAFGLGIWLTTLLRDRVHLGMAPLALAGLIAGGVGVAALLSGDEYARYIDEGTLQYPLGYRNANAAFFLIALWPAVALAASRELDWRVRALALATATLCVELALLSQSRGSMIGVALALAVFLLASKERARGVAWLALAAVPALVVIPALTDLYATGDLESYAGTAELRSAGRAVVAGALVALALGAAAALAGRRMTPVAERAARANRAVGLATAAALVVGLLTFIAATGDPAQWIDERVDEFLTQGSPGTEGTTRFGVNAGSERDDIWRVALEIAGDEPLLGSGGGGYHYEYPARRGEDGVESVRDAHSVELEVLSELGIPGAALFLLAIAAAAAGAWRMRRASLGHAALSTAALAAAAYWLGHASIDWFWTYPALTAPVFAVLGSACARAAPAEGPAEASHRGRRRLLAVAAALLAVSVVPPYLAERYVESGYANWRDDPERAQRDLDRARDLNPLSVEPLLAGAAIARADGDREAAIDGFEEVLDERSEEWAAHYFLAELHRNTDPARARAELAAAEELNPLGFEVEKLRERLAEPRRRGSG